MGEQSDFCNVKVEGKMHILEFKDIDVSKMETGALEFKAGKQSCTVQITVQDSDLEFVVPLQSETKATELRVTVLEVEVSRKSGKVAWYKGRKEITDPNGKYEFVAEGCIRKLLIKKTSVDDEGTYSCQASEETKTSTTVTVSALNVKFDVSLEDKVITENENAVFQVQVNEEDVPCRWLKDGVELEEEEGKYSLLSEGNSHILTCIACPAERVTIECVVHKSRSSCNLIVNRGAAGFEEGLVDLTVPYKTKEFE